MIDQLVKVLVDAGATPVQAARAAVVLDAGGSVLDAWERMEGIGPRVLTAPADTFVERVAGEGSLPDIQEGSPGADQLLDLIGPERSEGPRVARPTPRR